MTSYLDHFDRRCVDPVVHSWVEHTRLNLAQHYGLMRADQIIDGRDPKTQADLQRWASLGRRSAA
jgi:N-acyl-D-aspartate/D-glutamate deacylase